MRLAFLGTAPIAVPILDALVAAGHEVAIVFTQPDRPAGRGGKRRQSPVKEAALRHNLPITQPENLRGEAPAEALKHAAPELAIVVAYGQLIPPAMLAIPPHGCINLHASLLPKYRGAAPVPAAILNGENETGLTLFRLNERFDEGAILSQQHIPITAQDTTACLLKKMGQTGPGLVCSMIADLAAGTVTPLPQDNTIASRAPKFKKSDGEINWRLTRVEIDRIVRAYQPWPLGFFFYTSGNKKIRIVVLCTESCAWEAAAVPGTLLAANPRDGIVIQCGDGALRLIDIKPEGKRAMTANEYMRGARWVEGHVLSD